MKKLKRLFITLVAVLMVLTYAPTKVRADEVFWVVKYDNNTGVLYAESTNEQPSGTYYASEEEAIAAYQAGAQATITYGGQTTYYANPYPALLHVNSYTGSTSADDLVMKLFADCNYETYDASFTISVPMTLDLNGHIMAFGQYGKKGYTYRFQKDFVLKDTSVGETGVLYGINNTAAILLGTSSAGSTFTLESGTIKSETAIFDTYSNCTINVTGGHMVSYSKYGVGDSRGIVAELSSGCALNISGGEFRSDQSAKSWDTMSFDPMGYPTKNVNANSTISVTGGTFSGQAIQKYVPGYTADQSFTNENPTITVGDYNITRTTVSSPYGAAAYDVYLYTVAPVPVNYVAQIGEDKYESLQAAIAAVPANTQTTIKMIANETIVGNDGVTIPNNKNIILDLNGKTIQNYVNENKSSQVIKNLGTLTITDTSANKDGLITNVLDTNAQSGHWDGRNWYTNVITNCGTLVINEGRLYQTGTGTISFAVDNQTNGGSYDATATIAGGTLESECSTVRLFCNSTTRPNTITVTGGTVISKRHAFYLQAANSSANKGSITIEDVVVDSTWNYFHIDGGSDFSQFTVSIEGGKFKGNNTVEDGTIAGYLKGGKYVTQPSGYIATGYEVADNTDSDKTTYPYIIGEAVTYVAQIGEQGYETLAAAIAAVPTDGTETTITMIGNEQVVAGVTIANSQNVVLELNGHTVSGNTDSTKTYALITNRGTLTIQDSTDTLSDGTGTGLLTTYISNPDTGDVPGYASNTITNNGALTVKSGKIVNNGSGYACYAIDNQTNGTLYSPVLNIEGGRMEQMNAYTYAVRMFCNSTTNLNTLNMSGGVVTGGYGLWLQTPNAKANKAQLTISGGTIDARDGAALYIGGTKADNSNIQISISGATIGRTGVIIQGPLSGTYGSVEITSGRIFNVQCGANVEKFITGGTYNGEPTAAYIADGYKAIYNGDGTWTVVKDYVAQIGTKGYDTLEAAFAEVADSQTIEVLKDIELTSALDLSLAGKTVVLDLGGNTLTGRTNLRSGNLTIKNGSVVATGETQALNVYGSSDSSATNYSVLTIANNVDVTADVYGVCLFGNAYNTNGYGAVINIAGTVTTTGDTKNGAVFVSGNLGQNIAEANNVINITGTVTSATDAAIALNGLATVNVKAGANITGATAIAVKRGTLNVEAGATVKATGAKNENPAAYGNGTEMTGAAVSVTNTYSQYGPLAVNITGGTFTSTNGSAVYKKNAEYANDATIAISGGTFSDKPNADFIVAGYAATKLDDGYYIVGLASTYVIDGTTDAETTQIAPVIVTENAETTAILTPVDVSDTENLGKTTKISEAEISGFKDTFEDTTSEKIKEVKIITGLSATQEVDGNAAPQTVITNIEGKTIFEAKAFGGQLRYDKKMNGATPNPSCQPEASSEEKSAAINYVDLRLAFQFTLPEGVSIDDAQWGWRLFYDDTDDSKYVDVTGSNYMERSYDGTVRAQGTKTYTSNLVITNLRLDLRKNVNFKAVMTLTYVGTDGVKYTIVQSQETPLARSIEPIVVKLSNDGDLLPEADAYIDALKNIIG